MSYTPPTHHSEGSDETHAIEEDACYSTAVGVVSIYDLLHSFADESMQVNGISRVSDLHLKVGEPARFRVDGDLETIDGGEVLDEKTIQRLLRPILAEQVVKEYFEEGRRGVDKDTAYFWPEKQINFRLNLFTDRDGSACVIRMLPRHVPEFYELGFMSDLVTERLSSLRQGLVLVTGVTSSGKTTTVASLINLINHTRKARIITLEDPIEFVFKSEQSLISQRELGLHIDSFSTGLRSALRENPDMIYVGEIRDQETAALALAAAETGHLVVSTLHTKDVKGTFSRIVDMFPADRSDEMSAQLSFSIAAIVSQKLAHRKDSPGRIPVFEVLLNDPALANIVRTGKWHQLYSKIETGMKLGMNTLEQHLLVLVEQGAITSQEALQLANESSIMDRLPS